MVSPLKLSVYGVVGAGVAADLGEAWSEVGEGLDEGIGVPETGFGEAAEVVADEQAVGARHAPGQAAGGAQAGLLKPAGERGQETRSCPTGLAGQAEGADAMFRPQSGDDREDAGQHVEVLVGVEVGRAQAGLEEALDLGAQFGLDVLSADAAAEVAGEEGRPVRREAAVVVYQGRDLLWW